eukprot:sb/3477422/
MVTKHSYRIARGASVSESSYNKHSPGIVYQVSVSPVSAWLPWLPCLVTMVTMVTKHSYRIARGDSVSESSYNRHSAGMVYQVSASPVSGLLRFPPSFTPSNISRVVTS